MKVRDLTEISSFKNNVLIHYSSEMMCATNPKSPIQNKHMLAGREFNGITDHMYTYMYM